LLLLGDCLEQMKTLEDNSVDAVVTDPPYGLAFMNKKWDYSVPSVDIWREVFRVLKPGGHVLSFGGTRTYHRMVVNIEDAGFEIRDQVQWLYGSGFPKSHNVSKAIDKMAGADREVIQKNKNHRNSSALYELGFQGGKSDGSITAPATPEAKTWDGWGSALKPANEPVCLARKPLEKGLTLAENVLKYGTGGLNIDGCRIEGKFESGWSKSGSKESENTAMSGKNYEREPKPDNTQGRWPANLILDETAAEMLDAQSIAGGIHSAGKARTKTVKSEYDASSYHAPVERQMNRFDDKTIGASRFFYVAKASKRERNAGLDVANGETNIHPTLKPIKLMEYLITLVTPSKGTVLDPFMGSGSTGVAAKNLNRNFIGIEMNEEYFEIAKKRITRC
jgi:DNA modification methylase